MANEIFIEFKVGIEQLSAATQVLKELGLVDDDVAKGFQNLTKESGKADKGLEKITVDVSKLDKEIKAVADTLKKMPKEILEQQAIDTLKMANDETRSLTSIISANIDELAKLEAQGKRNTKEYRDRAKAIAQLSSHVKDARERVKALTSETPGIDAAIMAVEGLAGGYAVLEGITALAGDSNEDLQKSLLKVNAAMAILQGLQQTRLALEKDGILVTQAYTVAQKTWNIIVGTSTGLLKAFRIALAATGIGVVILAVVAIARAWQDWREEMEAANAEMRRSNEINEQANAIFAEQSAELTAIIRLLENENTTNKEKAKALETVNEKYGDQIGHFKSIEDLENRFIDRAEAYIKVLQLRAQAQAALNLAVQKQEEILKNQQDPLGENKTFWDELRGSLFGAVGAYEKVGDIVEDVAGRSKETNSRLTEDFNAYLDLFNDFQAEAASLVEENRFELDRADTDLEWIDRYFESLLARYGEMLETAREIGLEAIRRDVLTDLFADTEFTVPDVAIPNIKLMEDYHEKVRELERETKEFTIQELADIQQKRAETFQNVITVANEVSALAQQINQNQLNAELAALDKKLDSQLISQERYESEVKRLRRKSAEDEKKIALFEALVNAAAAIVNALAINPAIVPFVAALGAAQVAQIAATPIPAFAAGTDSAPPGLKWVGEEGPELRYDRGGYGIIPAGPSKAIMDAYKNRFKVPNINYPDMAAAVSSGVASPGGINPNELADAMERAMKRIPVEQHRFDEQGYTRSVKRGSSRTEHRGGRYKL